MEGDGPSRSGIRPVGVPDLGGCRSVLPCVAAHRWVLAGFEEAVVGQLEEEGLVPGLGHRLEGGLGQNPWNHIPPARVPGNHVGSARTAPRRCCTSARRGRGVFRGNRAPASDHRRAYASPGDPLMLIGSVLPISGVARSASRMNRSRERIRRERALTSCIAMTTLHVRLPVGSRVCGPGATPGLEEC